MKDETMSAQTSEADARILIDDLLKEALWDPADKVREGLDKIGIAIKDSKEGTTWRRQ